MLQKKLLVVPKRSPRSSHFLIYYKESWHRKRGESHFFVKFLIVGTQRAFLTLFVLFARCRDSGEAGPVLVPAPGRPRQLCFFVFPVLPPGRPQITPRTFPKLTQNSPKTFRNRPQTDPKPIPDRLQTDPRPTPDRPQTDPKPLPGPGGKPKTNGSGHPCKFQKPRATL